MADTADYLVLCDSSLGDELTAQECRKLASIMGTIKLQDGELLVAEGKKDYTLYLLADGHLSVISRIDDQDKVLYTMKKGECAGTRAFVDRAPRRATLRADGDAIVYTLEPNPFESLLKTDPNIVYKVMRALFRITHMNLMRMNLESQALTNYITRSGGRH